MTYFNDPQRSIDYVREIRNPSASTEPIDYPMEDQMRLAIEISTDNAAFDGNPYGECARILRVVAERLDTEGYDGPTGSIRDIQDINGNRCGSWSFYSE